MTVISRTALLPHSTRQLFELVCDVEAYPQYMDGCVGAEILCRQEDLVEARLDLARAGITHSFSTRNRLVAEREIVLELIEGPFDYFRGRWGFLPLGESGCKISLDLEFAMNSRLLGAAAARMFEGVTSNLVDAVSRRARQLYG